MNQVTGQVALTFVVYGGAMKTVLNFFNPPRTRAAPKPKGYSAAREVKDRAAITRPDDSPKQRKAFSRLDRILDANKPLKSDVPRGFYINIQV